MTDKKTSGNGSYQIITPPNLLKAKVGSGKGIDPKLLKRAQALVDGMSGDFEERAVVEADRILELAAIAEKEDAEVRTIEEAGLAVGDDAMTVLRNADTRIVGIFRISHELKGQGGTFGYPLISRIGGLLCQYIESVPEHDRVDLEVVRAHASALRVVAAAKINGEGGPVEQQVIAELQRLLKKAAG